MFTNWKIDLYSFDEDSGTHSSTVTSTLSGFHDVLVRTRLGSAKDTFEFKKVNYNGDLDDYFSDGDKVLIYYGVNKTALTSTDILMTGVVNKLPYNDSTRTVQRVEGNNYSESLANAITYVDGSNVDVVTFLRNALAAVNTNNPSFQVTWSTTNRSLKTDNTSFPNGERWFNKSLLQLLERYSSKTYNQDVNYYWYVDAENRLHWIPETGDASESFDTSVDDYTSIKGKVDTSDVINFIIIKGDLSPSGRVIQDRVDNSPSRVSKGFKPKIVTSAANYAKELVETDRSAYPATFDEGDTDPNTYPFTTAWESKINRASNPSMTEGSLVTVSNGRQYNRAITEQAKYRLRNEAQRILDDRANGKYQVEVTFRPGGTPSGSIWRIGDVINVTIPEIGKSTDPMRVESAEYSSTSERYTLIEDEGTY